MSDILDAFKAFLPDWPEWLVHWLYTMSINAWNWSISPPMFAILSHWCRRALDVLLVMTGLLTVTIFFCTFYTPAEANSNSSSSSAKISKERDLHREFDSFRRKYLVVYLVIMLADWMQGTHMYTLYLSYNVNISALFLTGFLSGACFAPFLGSAVDKFGRKNACIVYCVLEIIINCLEHSTNFGILLFGRVLGGISTNLLFSAFESWMTTEHRKKGFPEEWLSRTYSEVSKAQGMSFTNNRLSSNSSILFTS